jgi:broad specificity phosphatase PhoE
MSRLLLLRHGQSEWNAQQRWQGHGDPSLTELGRTQAREAAARLASAGIERMVSSDLARAFETAEILAAALGLALERDALWRERDIGIWTGLRREEIGRAGPLSTRASAATTRTSPRRRRIRHDVARPRARAL